MFLLHLISWQNAIPNTCAFFKFIPRFNLPVHKTAEFYFLGAIIDFHISACPKCKAINRPLDARAKIDNSIKKFPATLD